MDNNQVNILIGATKNFLWKFGIHTAIQNMSGYTISGEYASGSEIIASCRLGTIQLLILDQQLIDMSASELQAQLHSEHISIPILLIGDNRMSDTDISKLFHSGIKGYILNNCTEEQLIDAITHVSNNMEWCSPTCNPKLFFKKQLSTTLQQTHYLITQREHEVLHLMAKGHSNSEISDLLCLSINTVQNHVCNIYSKFGIRERLKAVHYALKQGLVEY